MSHEALHDEDDTMDADADEGHEDPGGYLGALQRLAVAMSPKVQSEANDLLCLYALNGVPDASAAKAVVELYSPPRVTKELLR